MAERPVRLQGVGYTQAEDGYFERRGLRRHAGVWSLWALAVGAVISGHFSGWNLGLSVAGWGGMLIATLIISVMYLGLTFSIAEMSPALPHTGGAYSFARTGMGPWGGFLTGLSENVEYVLQDSGAKVIVSVPNAGRSAWKPDETSTGVTSWGRSLRIAPGWSLAAG